MTAKKEVKPAPAKPNGRPLVPIDWIKFDKLCAMQCTLLEIAAFFDCSDDTIERACKRDKGMGFAEYSGIKRSLGHIALRRKMLQASDKSTRMQIFLAKNWLGFTDRVEQIVEHSGEIKSTQSNGISTEKLEQILSDPKSTELAQELALRLATSASTKEEG